MKRWQTAGVTLALGLLLVGCGGGDNGKTTNTVDTGSNEGTLANLEISPSPGNVFIAKNTTFQITWADGTTPPPTFSVTLQRYKETDSGTTISAQKTNLDREGNAYVWDLSRSDSTTLDSPGVYYVEIDSGTEQYLASYIVSGERGEAVAATAAAKTRAAAETTTGESALVHVVTVRPASP